MNKTALLTIIFPMEVQFLIDFFDSLERQTYSNFDIVVVNDNYENFSKIKEKYNNLSIIELPYTGTPAKNREYGINYCIDQKYDILIFGDSDDYFSDNRVEVSLKYLISNDIVVNDLNLFNETGVYIEKYISNRLKNKSKINYQFINDKNIFGFTNTAVRLKKIDRVLFDDSLIAVDWYFFQQLLKNNTTAIFSNTAISFYRQYKDNIIGLNNESGEFMLWWEKEKKI